MLLNDHYVARNQLLIDGQPLDQELQWT